jgi:hypothetical protein
MLYLKLVMGIVQVRISAKSTNQTKDIQGCTFQWSVEADKVCWEVDTLLKGKDEMAEHPKCSAAGSFHERGCSILTTGRGI